MYHDVSFSMSGFCFLCIVGAGDAKTACRIAPGRMLAENSRGFDRSLLQLVKDSCNELCLFGTRATFLVMVSMWKVSQPSVRHFLMDGKDPRMESEEAWHGVRFFPLSGRNPAGFVTNPNPFKIGPASDFLEKPLTCSSCFGTFSATWKGFLGSSTFGWLCCYFPWSSSRSLWSTPSRCWGDNSVRGLRKIYVFELQNDTSMSLSQNGTWDIFWCWTSTHPSQII